MKEMENKQVCGEFLIKVTKNLESLDGPQSFSCTMVGVSSLEMQKRFYFFGEKRYLTFYHSDMRYITEIIILDYRLALEEKSRENPGFYGNFCFFQNWGVD